MESLSSLWEPFLCVGDNLLGEEREGQGGCALAGERDLDSGSSHLAAALVLGGVKEGDFTDELLILVADLAVEEWRWYCAGRQQTVGEREGASLNGISLPAGSLNIPPTYSSSALVFGGMSSDYEHLNDLWLLAVLNEPFHHSVSGEEDSGNSDGDASSNSSGEKKEKLLSTSPSPFSLQCSPVRCIGDVPSPRYRHGSCVLGSQTGEASDDDVKKLCVYGGEGAEEMCSVDELFLGTLSPSKPGGGGPSIEYVCTWQRLAVSTPGVGLSRAPTPRFSFTMTPMSSRELLLVGGAYFASPGMQASLDQVAIIRLDRADGVATFAPLVQDSESDAMPKVNGHGLCELRSDGTFVLLGGKDQHRGTDDLIVLTVPPSLLENNGPPSETFSVKRIVAPPEVEQQKDEDASGDDEEEDATRTVQRVVPWPHWRYLCSVFPLLGAKKADDQRAVLLVGGHCRHPDQVASYKFVPDRLKL